MENFIKAYLLSFFMTLGGIVILYFFINMPQFDSFLFVIITYLFLLTVFVPLIIVLNTLIFVFLALPFFAMNNKLGGFGFGSTMMLAIAVGLINKLVIDPKIYDVYSLIFAGFGVVFGLGLFRYWRKFNQYKAQSPDL